MLNNEPGTHRRPFFSGEKHVSANSRDLLAALYPSLQHSQRTHYGGKGKTVSVLKVLESMGRQTYTKLHNTQQRKHSMRTLVPHGAARCSLSREWKRGEKWAMGEDSGIEVQISSSGINYLSSPCLFSSRHHNKRIFLFGPRIKGDYTWKNISSVPVYGCP